MFVKSVVDRVFADDATAAAGFPEPEYWHWYDNVDNRLVKQLANDDLRAAWVHTGRVHKQFLKAAQAAVNLAAKGESARARIQLNEVFSLSNELTGLLVGGSIAELVSAIQAHEQLLATRYERDFLEATHMGRFTLRLSDNVVMEADDSFLDFCGYTREDLIGSPVNVLLGKPALSRMTTAARNMEKTERVAIKAKHGAGHPITLDVIAYIDHDNHAELLHAFAVNVTQTETEAQQRRLLSTAVEASGQSVMITNGKQEIVYVNPAFTLITGYESEEVLGKTPRFLQGAETSQATRVAIREALAANKPVRVEILNYHKTGRPYWQDLSIVPVLDDEGEVTHFVAIEVDITERKKAEQEIARIAMEDHLTGLANRRAAEDRLELEWGRARRDHGEFAIAIADIDRFKLVNDQYGHHIGDQVLKHVSGVMATNLRGGDWIARWGGEEFIVCFHDLDRRGALTAAERLRKQVKAKSISLPQGELPVTVSMGVTLYGTEHKSIEEMLAQADALLYEAKHAGRDKVMCAGKDASRKGGVIWEGSQVQSALHEGRVLPAYQPIVDLRTGRVVAEEALARIRAKDDSLIPAINFIQAAEALHLIGAIDETISSSALARCAVSIAGQEEEAFISHFINLSPQFLANPESVDNLLERARTYCARCGMDNAATKPMVIEITERQSADILLLKKHLKPLMDFGFQLALDDFGSGYSSFLYLAELPVNFIKIEGWMVNRINKDKRTRQLVETLVNTAQKFKILTVAECVEDPETAQVLCDIGVDWAQGYYFARPAVE
ncbi:MAG: EAL domain-containing protein [Burkholderiales bacterium]|nr:EAL domain-containing protein [Burkholderiales bacterium]